MCKNRVKSGCLLLAQFSPVPLAMLFTVELYIMQRGCICYWFKFLEVTLPTYKLVFEVVVLVAKPLIAMMFFLRH
ncbi:hypothetical protein SDC9_199966 [bioreactor metagenome]|uniref:Uncharacterized protein n=1 Tax=bioreactor metagenome TaxID=1076179 RepID=A0A645IMI8_9ZZZZ